MAIVWAAAQLHWALSGEVFRPSRADALQTQGHFADAARALEAVSPFEPEDAVVMLSRAVVLRAATLDLDAMRTDLARLSHAGVPHSDLGATLVTAIDRVGHAVPAEVRRRLLADCLGDGGWCVGPGSRVRAWILLGHAHRASGSDDEAEDAYSRAAAAATRYVDRFRAYVGMASIRHARFMRHEVPRYTGPRDRAAYARWVERVAGPWLAAREAEASAIDEAWFSNGEAGVAREEAPGSASVEAVAMVAARFDRLAVWTRSVEADAPPEPLAAWVAALPRCPTRAELAARQAMNAYQMCVSEAVRARAGLPFLRTCEENLARIDPQRFPMSDEIVPATRATRLPTWAPRSARRSCQSDAPPQRTLDRQVRPGDRPARRDARPTPMTRGRRLGFVVAALAAGCHRPPANTCAPPPREYALHPGRAAARLFVHGARSFEEAAAVIHTFDAAGAAPVREAVSCLDEFARGRTAIADSLARIETDGFRWGESDGN